MTLNIGRKKDLIRRIETVIPLSTLCKITYVAKSIGILDLSCSDM